MTTSLVAMTVENVLVVSPSELAFYLFGVFVVGVWVGVLILGLVKGGNK